MFKEGLKTAQEKEVEVLNHYKKKYPRAYRLEGFADSCDIVIPELARRVEVKYDRLVDKTGNVFVETGNSDGTPSGLTSSKSDFYVFCVSNEKRVMTTSRLKELALFSKYPQVLGGDNKAKKGTLVPVKIIKQYSQPL